MVELMENMNIRMEKGKATETPSADSAAVMSISLSPFIEFPWSL